MEAGDGFALLPRPMSISNSFSIRHVHFYSISTQTSCNMRQKILTTVVIVGLILCFMGLWKLNKALGRRTGEIDVGRWHLYRDGNSSWYDKGMDPNNRYLDAYKETIDPDKQYDDYRDAEKTWLTKDPNYRSTEEGYGAICIQRGWLNDAYLWSSGWQLFETEAEAVEFLTDNGIEERRILFRYK